MELIIARSNKLSVILNRKEVFELLSTPKLLKHRVLLGLTYAAGLRLFEVAALCIAGLDTVKFSFQDYKTAGTIKVMTLAVLEFIR